MWFWIIIIVIIFIVAVSSSDNSDKKSNKIQEELKTRRSKLEWLYTWYISDNDLLLIQDFDKFVKQKEQEKARIQRQKEKEKIKKTIENMCESRLSKIDLGMIEPTTIRKKYQYDNIVLIDDINYILGKYTTFLYTKKESLVLKGTFNIKKFNKSDFKGIDYDTKSLEAKIVEVNYEILQINRQVKIYKKYYSDLYNGFKMNKKDSVIERINNVINYIDLPKVFPKFWDLDYEPEKWILIVDVMVPNIVDLVIKKNVELKTKNVEKEITKKEYKEYKPKIHPSILLRLAYEISKSNVDNIIKYVAINWFVEYNSKATWHKIKDYVCSLTFKTEDMDNIILDKIDPIVAFSNLKGKTSWVYDDIIPIVPTLSLDREDSRFIEKKDIIDNLSSSINLASMDWQDFEHLIAELFSKEFCKDWAEVKTTQSSKDRWVDAIAFDPDPIKWWKFVIQAKRYTNTVWVSAVRDLCAVVKKEWASRGILVTTSSFWVDAYKFAENEPITLLNWSELLWLLEKHNYSFKIDLEEAKKELKKQSI